jgi:hypothetical protein
MNKSVLFSGLFSVTALVGAVAACSSTTITSTGGGNDGGSEGGVSSLLDGGKSGSDGGKTDTDSGTTDTDSGATADEACAAEATLDACGKCCTTNHSAGYQVFANAIIKCACEGPTAGGPGACATECAATLCAATPKQPDQACLACANASVQTNGACQPPVVAACNANADCVDFQTNCMPGCEGKQ